MKNLILLLASLFFYTWGEGKIVAILLTSSLVDFSCGLLIEKGNRKLGLGLSIAFNLAILGVFKYLNFTFDNLIFLSDLVGFHFEVPPRIPQITLPIGISFYTFQTMSYTIDVYRRQVKASRNFLQFATYVSLFPQLIAGPIVRYADIHKQLKKKDISFERFSEGATRFIIGLAKKVLIANTFAEIADGIFTEQINIHDLSSGFAWIGILAYTIQIYFDFSGYSDMAIGLGRMFGFDFLENFNYPYIAKSIREFWRRWHISLSTWFRDYVYISLGGNRNGPKATYINLFIVFFVTGLWHGASWNFVVWGLFHGTFLAIERSGFDKRLNTWWRPVQHLYTLLVVVVGWVFFRADNLPDALLIIKKMFLFSSGDVAVNSYLNFFHVNLHSLFFLLVAIVFSMPVYGVIYKRLMNSKFKWVYSAAIIILFFFTILYLNADTYNPFIYFRF